MQASIFIAVIEIRLDPIADYESEFRPVRIDRRVSSIEYAVNISPQKNSVTNVMFASNTVGLDVRCFQRGQHSAAGDRALPPIRISDSNSECALTKAGF